MLLDFQHGYELLHKLLYVSCCASLLQPMSWCSNVECAACCEVATGSTETTLPVLLCRVQGFPTIKAFVNGRMIDYNGDRSAGHLKDWAISLIPQKVRARLTTGPEVGVVLLFHSSGRGMSAVTAH